MLDHGRKGVSMEFHYEPLNWEENISLEQDQSEVDQTDYQGESSSETVEETGEEMSEQSEDTSNYDNYPNSTCDIVSRVAYLAGVPKRIFENEHEPPQWEIYEELETEKEARIVRNLCTLRTILERKYREINQAIQYELKNLDRLPEYISKEIIDQLRNDGLEIIKANRPLNQYLMDINQYIQEHISYCQGIFPIWIEWQYIKELFIMPDGKTDRGLKKAWANYMGHISQYPYQVYINWRTGEEGNILYNDQKFIKLLYQRHNQVFHGYSYVIDAGNLTKEEVYKFLDQSERTAIVVDCENSDPYKFYATLMNLEPDKLDKIKKIILYNDVHTESTWSILHQHLRIPVEHEMIPRIKENKSLVDIRLTAGTCQEFYENHIDSFIIVSSDSDYWALITSLPKAHFLVMVEYSKCGGDLKRALKENHIFYCYIDDFCTGKAASLKTDAILCEVKDYLKTKSFNIYSLLEQVYMRTAANFSDSEKEQFFTRYIKRMSLRIDKEGNVTLQLP